MENRKKWARMLAIGLSIVLVFGLLAGCALFPNSEEFIFTLQEDDTYAVTRYDWQKLNAYVKIPATHQGKAVTSIGEGAFRDCIGLTSVTIPDSVTSIGDWAFANCTGLTSITIGSGVTSIGDDAFAYCDGLTSITIPDSVTSIGEWAFGGCNKLIEVQNLSALDIQSGKGGYGGVGLYAKNVYSATEGASKLHTDNNGYLFYVDTETCFLMGYLGKETKLTLPDTYEGKPYDIYQYAFAYCMELTEITIPEGVTSTGWHTFENCTGLTEISIPDSVTSIGDWAFEGCTGLTEITIPDSVTSIGKWAFANCDGLTSVILGSGVTSIGDGAFANCIGLTSVTMGSGVTFIGDRAFEGCTGLTEITIPDSVTSIGALAFSGCDSLKTVYFKNPNGWRADDSTLSELEDPATAAEYLTKTYVSWAWTRE